MPRFSAHSIEQIETLHRDLKRVLWEAIKYIDFRVVEGFRGEFAQNQAYAAGFSTKKWQESKHNIYPAVAVDIAPWPIDWEDTARFYFFAGQIIAIARSMDINLRWGGDWDMDTLLHDQSLFDLGHFELI